MNNNQEFKEWVEKSKQQNNRHMIKQHKTNKNLGFLVLSPLLLILIFTVLINTIEPLYVWAKDQPILNVLVKGLRINLGEEIDLHQEYVQELNIQHEDIRITGAVIDPLNIIVLFESNERPTYDAQILINDAAINQSLNLPLEEISENYYAVTADLSFSQEIEKVTLVYNEKPIEIPIDKSKVLPLKTISIHQQVNVDDASIIFEELEVGAYTSRIKLEYIDGESIILGAPQIRDQNNELIGNFYDGYAFKSESMMTQFELNIRLQQPHSIRFNQGQLNWDQENEFNLVSLDKISKIENSYTFDLETLQFEYIPEAFSISNIERNDNRVTFEIINKNDNFWFWTPFIWQQGIAEDALSVNEESVKIELYFTDKDKTQLEYQVSRGDVEEINQVIKIEY